MAKFVITSTITKYFDHLNKNSTTGKVSKRMEQWWLCAQLGLICNKQGESPGEGSSDMVDYFIKSMEDGQARIRGFLLERHFENVDASEGKDRDILEQEMARMLAKNDSSLSDDATRMLDRYAVGGMEIIKDKIRKQTELNMFMIKYHKLVNELTEG